MRARAAMAMRAQQWESWRACDATHVGVRRSDGDGNVLQFLPDSGPTCFRRPCSMYRVWLSKRERAAARPHAHGAALAASPGSPLTPRGRCDGGASASRSRRGRCTRCREGGIGIGGVGGGGTADAGAESMPHSAISTLEASDPTDALDADGVRRAGEPALLPPLDSRRPCARSRPLPLPSALLPSLRMAAFDMVRSSSLTAAIRSGKKTIMKRKCSIGVPPMSPLSFVERCCVLLRRKRISAEQLARSYVRRPWSELIRWRRCEEAEKEKTQRDRETERQRDRERGRDRATAR